MWSQHEKGKRKIVICLPVDVVKTGQDHHVLCVELRLTFRVDLNVYLLLWAENMSWRLGCFLESHIVNNVQVVMLVVSWEADKKKVTLMLFKTTDNQDWKFDLECLYIECWKQQIPPQFEDGRKCRLDCKPGGGHTLNLILFFHKG